MPRYRVCLAGLMAVAVLGASTARATVLTQGAVRIEFSGSYASSDAALDKAVTSWMAAYDIHDAQLAVRRNGALIVSHAYTYGATYPLVTTGNVFRLASISKMVAAAAFSQLLAAGTLTGGERVFPYLGINRPLLSSETPDKRVNNIISLELAEHTSGLPGSGYGDPLFAMRDIEVAYGHAPLTKQAFASYLYGVKLASVPGYQENYSNVGYTLLGMVIERASGMSFFDYATTHLFKPLGMTNWLLSPTNHALASSNEVFADDPYTGRSVFNLSPTAPLAPFNFEGGDIVWEVADAPSDLVTNAESVSLFAHTWNAYGLGGRAVDYARDGCMPGATTWVESQTADIDWALLFNKAPVVGGVQQCLGFSSAVIDSIRNVLASQ